MRSGLGGGIEVGEASLGPSSRRAFMRDFFQPLLRKRWKSDSLGYSCGTGQLMNM